VLIWKKNGSALHGLGYPSPIHPIRKYRQAYDAALKFAVENIDEVSIFNGTHNEKSQPFFTELMEQHNIRRDDFSVILPVIWHWAIISVLTLPYEGYNIAKYLPYGPSEVYFLTWSGGQKKTLPLQDKPAGDESDHNGKEKEKKSKKNKLCTSIIRKPDQWFLCENVSGHISLHACIIFFLWNWMVQ